VDSITEVDPQASARGVYRRAIRSSLRRRGRVEGAELPTERLVMRGATMAVEHLAAYDRVCGFRLADAVPVTYPHVLAFPVAMRLMCTPDFPFSVIGLVHVANRITQARPIHVTERLDFTVSADALRPHAGGRQFDIVATAFVGGVEVWHGVSTYLKPNRTRNGRRTRRPDVPEPPARSPAKQARSTGVGDVSAERDAPNALWQVTPDTGRAYAAVSDDRNPIHVSRVGARVMGFRRPIAHGMWTMARAAAALEGRLGDTYTIDVAFRRPVPLPSTLAWRASRDRDGWTIAVADATSGKLALAGSIAPA